MYINVHFPGSGEGSNNYWYICCAFVDFILFNESQNIEGGKQLYHWEISICVWNILPILCYLKELPALSPLKWHQTWHCCRLILTEANIQKSTKALHWAISLHEDMLIQPWSSSLWRGGTFAFGPNELISWVLAQGTLLSWGCEGN